MFKIVFIIAGLISLLYSTPTINIQFSPVKIENFTLEYFVDKTGVMDIEKVKEEKFLPDINTMSLGKHKEYVWIRFKLHNASRKKQILFIHNEHGYLSNAVEFYDQKSRKSLLLDFENTYDARKKMYGTDVIFEVSLKVGETKEIYIKSYMKIVQFPYFKIYDERNSKKDLSYNNNFLIIILGMFIALSIYHFILYINTGYKEYIFYTLYLSSAAVWEIFVSGMMANSFGVYLNTLTEKYFLSILLAPIFLTLFTQTIFSTQQKYKKENQYLNSIIIIFTISFFIGLFYDTTLALHLASLLYLYFFTVLLFSVYSIYTKGNPLAFIFLISNGIFAIFTATTDSYYLGIINYNNFVFNAASIGLIFESIGLAFIISYRIKILQKSELSQTKKLTQELQSSREKDKILFQQNKMISMGEMIENIAHQWRQPLAQINSSVLLIDDYLQEKNIYDTNIEKELDDIEKLTRYMSNTINSFRKFFDKDKKENTFYFKNTLEDALLILNSHIQKNGVSVDLKLSEDYLYKGLEDEFKQTILILLNNAIDALNDRKIVSKAISISVKKEGKKYRIKVCDNAGGVNPQHIEKIFEPYFTTKHKSQGTGLGLYISKLIIEENMLGKLSVANTFTGACFSIELS